MCDCRGDRPGLSAVEGLVALACTAVISAYVGIQVRSTTNTWIPAFKPPYDNHQTNAENPLAFGRVRAHCRGDRLVALASPRSSPRGRGRRLDCARTMLNLASLRLQTVASFAMQPFVSSRATRGISSLTARLKARVLAILGMTRSRCPHFSERGR